MKKPMFLATAVAAALADAADAATVGVVVQSLTSHSSSGTSAANISSSTARWMYDTDTGLLSQRSGLFNARFNIAPTTTLFRHSVTGLVVGGGGSASATSFACAEGNFGATVGASICGNYNFGANYINESSISYGPGTAASRTLGGDDMSIGAQQSVAAYNATAQISWAGTSLVLSNATPTSGYTWTLSLAPPPPPPAGFTVSMDANGLASGISNLDIGGALYNVSFSCFPWDSTCTLGPGTDLFLGNRDGAIAATEAIIGALASVEATEVYNFSYWISGEWSHFLVPYAASQGVSGCRLDWSCSTDVPGFAQYWAWEEKAFTSGPGWNGGAWSSDYDNWSLVRFTPVAAVPLPAAAWLFGSALFSLGVLKRNRE
jgi:hypothetical protein